jgi:hypothetical protein
MCERLYLEFNAIEGFLCSQSAGVDLYLLIPKILKVNNVMQVGMLPFALVSLTIGKLLLVLCRL